MKCGEVVDGDGLAIGADCGYLARYGFALAVGVHGGFRAGARTVEHDDPNVIAREGFAVAELKISSQPASGRLGDFPPDRRLDRARSGQIEAGKIEQP